MGIARGGTTVMARGPAGRVEVGDESLHSPYFEQSGWGENDKNPKGKVSHHLRFSSCF